jgi:phosphohistidine phosphatase SixA
MTSRNRPISRRSVCALVGLPFVARVDTAQAADSWSALRDGKHLALMRHALAPGNYDPPGFRLGDCATQRNLSDEGRAQARRAGDLFRANAISAARVFSSQWCRCVDTATLLGLGSVTEQRLLNAYLGNRDIRNPEQVQALLAWIAGQQLVPPVVLVTHEVVVSALCNASAASGEILVMRREGDGRLSLAGRQPTAL